MLHQKIKAEIPVAMKAKDQLRLDTLRMLTTSFTNELVATKRKPDGELADEETLAVIRREVKKRKEAAEAFAGAGRTESADKERAEQKILEAYLPAMMDEADVKKIVETKKAELGIDPSTGSGQAKKDIGHLMGAVMKQTGGLADGAMVKKLVESLF
jgi:hypothetical protein